MAIGFSQQSGIPFTEGLTKNRYIQRTFIQPEQHMRVEAVSLKYNPLRENLDVRLQSLCSFLLPPLLTQISIQGKNVVLVDDSLVRGTTVKKLIGLLRSAGAKMVHVRIASPPIKHPCYMGIDMKSHEVCRGRPRSDVMTCAPDPRVFVCRN
jgi:glutamine phosphoribosylpyrophosphate amidotransferase